jgi:hypothetical protein
MMVPPKGDFAMPLNAEARKIAGLGSRQGAGGRGPVQGAWRSGYHAGARAPVYPLGDDNTLQMATLILARRHVSPVWRHAAGHSARRLQGYSVAAWEDLGARRGPATQLKVTTTRMRPGYLRRNGVPHSGTRARGILRSLYGTQWGRLAGITSIVTDPQY